MTSFSDVRIFLCTTPTNMCYSFDSLMGRAQEVFDQDPTSGHLFLFVNRNPGTDRRLVADENLVLGPRWILHLVQEAGNRLPVKVGLSRNSGLVP